jgi:flagellar FliL protein
MPALAFTTTKFLVLPKVVQARGGGEEAGHEAGGGESSHEASKEDKGHGKEAASDHGKPKEGKEGKTTGKKKQTFPITKVIVNVAGTMGARYLMTSFTLAGTHNDFKTVIEENKDQILDLANTAMASKTINDLEKPGARNQIRAELMSIFNNALGNGIIQEIYFTEFAVQ